mmetsp:Transcript_102804/g.219887  ORF Transcript_102804/g.219887 Transcript_102804/m.219887 type:complete len:558 (-) Transcript_102804:132-1805(-)
MELMRFCIVTALALGPLALASGHGDSSSDEDLRKQVHELQSEVSHFREQLAAYRAELEATAFQATMEQPMMARHHGRRMSAPVVDPWAGSPSATDSIWLLLCGSLVMFMQCGFAMLEAGTCRAKNVQHILLKNLMDVCVGTLGWWFSGWAFAYGGPFKDGFVENKFIGGRQFFASGFLKQDSEGNQTPDDDGGKMLSWFFQWAFCSAAATIVSGGVAERVRFPGYGIYSFLMTAFIYPVVVCWTWGYGWLAGSAEDGYINKVGYMDFAGSGVVHMTGGVGALVGAICAGPRTGRFEESGSGGPASSWGEGTGSVDSEWDAHSVPLQVLGTFILWFGWYGFNCGSTLGLSDAKTGALAAQVAMNTTIAAATGGLTVFFAKFGIFKKYDVGGLCNGILAGLVSITAPCGNVETGFAFLIGFIGGFIYLGSSVALKKMKIDDPLDAFPVHGACGAWGVLAAGFFDWGKNFDHTHGWSGFDCVTGDDGTCMDGGNGLMIAANIVEILCITLWVAGLSLLIFLPLRMMGLLRATDEVQKVGGDATHHSPTKAYEGVLPKVSD